MFAAARRLTCRPSVVYRTIPNTTPSKRAISQQVFRPRQSTWQSAFHRARQDQQFRGYRRQAFNYQRFNSTSSLFTRWAARPTFYYEVGGLGLAAGGFYLLNLEEVPVSGRRRFNIVTQEFEASMAKGMYEQTIQEYRNQILPAYSREHRMVQRVLERLLPHAVGLENGSGWEVHVIDAPEKNAFVIPGGKVFVFRGILDVCQDEDGVAAVLGHEIAHNVAHHASERISRGAILLPILLGLWFLGIDPGIAHYAANLALTLPHSRAQESEADYIGLLMMAESCYDPQGAVGLWSRMEKDEKGAPPQFLSTHPSSYNRMGKIRDWMPEAEIKRQSGECGATGSYVNDFKRFADTSRWHDFSQT